MRLPRIPIKYGKWFFFSFFSVCYTIAHCVSEMKIICQCVKRPKARAMLSLGDQDFELMDCKTVWYILEQCLQ